MINITQVGDDQFLVEVLCQGGSLPHARRSLSELPQSIVLAMVSTRLDGVGCYVERVGVMVATGQWQLDDRCLTSTLSNDDTLYLSTDRPET